MLTLCSAVGLGTAGLVFRIRLYDTIDQIRAILIIGMFCTAENAMVIAVGCIPAIARLFRASGWKGSGEADCLGAAAAAEQARRQAEGGGGADDGHARVHHKNHFLRAVSALKDSRWDSGSKPDSLAKYLGPARYLRRDQDGSEGREGAYVVLDDLQKPAESSVTMTAYGPDSRS